MKRAILKINNPENIEVFTSLEPLFKKYKDLRELKYNIEHQITRLRIDYKTTDFVIRRVAVNGE